VVTANDDLDTLPELVPAITTRREVFGHWLRERLDKVRPLQSAVNWSRKYSLFSYPFATACCAMEFMAVNSPRFDIARFGPNTRASRPVRPTC